MRLVDIRPALGARELATRFRPPLRFADVRFDNYSPDLAFPSQAGARDELSSFAQAPDSPTRRLFRRPRPETQPTPGVYLDGGFGVGKTHLLASLWHQHEGPSTYLTFTELTAYIGFAGMDEAVRSFDRARLICIDEFELDDVASTLMVVSFLRGVLQRHPVRLAVTSNTIPGKLGEQRFSAADFKREIAAIASHFREIRIDGSDYRATHATSLPTDAGNPADATTDAFADLLAHLRTVHPVQFGAMFDNAGAVHIRGLGRIPDEPEALTWVAFVDKLYDARIPVRLDGDLEAVFDAPYRNGGYRKKYGRAESRMQAMQLESAGWF